MISLLEKEGEHQNDDKALHEALYEIMHAKELKPAEIFPICYEILITKEKGPKLAGFMRTIGTEKVANLFKSLI